MKKTIITIGTLITLFAIPAVALGADYKAKELTSKQQEAFAARDARIGYERSSATQRYVAIGRSQERNKQQASVTKQLLSRPEYRVKISRRQIRAQALEVQKQRVAAMQAATVARKTNSATTL